METGLRLKMPDGAAMVRFHPRLTPEEYAELMVRVVDATTCAELQKETARLAGKWGKQVDFDTSLE